MSRYVDDTILDEPGHSGGVPHHALTPGLRQCLDEIEVLARLRTE